MKKSFFTFALIFSVFFNAFTQNQSIQENSTQIINEQYETFSWAPVANAKRYNLLIQKLNNQSKWEDFKTYPTKETSVEVTFLPGRYRASIVSINALGKRSEPSPWSSFRILETTEPYIFESSFPSSEIWKSPVLALTDKSENPDSDNYIKPLPDYPENTLFVKGKNIFSPNTKFYLRPAEKSVSKGKPYTVLDSTRTEQELKILKRDSKLKGVYLEFDKSTLKPGYYTLTAINPGDYASSVSILMLADETINIEPYNFPINTRYITHCIDKTLIPTDIYFDVKASGITKETQFYLTQTEGSYAYPFETLDNLRNISLSPVKYQQIDQSQEYIVTFHVPLEDLKTDYYNFVAKDTFNSESFEFLFLNRQEDNPKEIIKSISSKYNKKEETITFNIKGENLDIYKNYAIVSEYNKDSDLNRKIPVTFHYKKPEDSSVITCSIPSSEVSIGKYALMIEGENTALFYFNLNESLKSKKIALTYKEFEDTFLRPDSATEGVNENDLLELNSTTITYQDHFGKFTANPPDLFPYLNFYAGLSDFEDLNQIHLNLEAVIWNKKYFNTGANICISDGLYLGIFGNYNPLPNWLYFNPYIGASLGVNIFNLDISASADFGLLLFQFFNIKYSAELHNMIFDFEFRNKISFGIRIPIKDSVYTRPLTGYDAYINTKDEILDETKIASLNKMTTSITFSGNIKELPPVPEGIQTIYDLPPSLEVIPEGTFANHKTLSSIYVNTSNLKTIGKDAFKNVKTISNIYIPDSVTTIEEGAFDGWTDGQSIVLGWNEYNNEGRDLTGLLTTNASVKHFNGKPYKDLQKIPKLYIEPNSFFIISVPKNKEGTMSELYKAYSNDNITIKSERDGELTNDLPLLLKEGSTLEFFAKGNDSYSKILFYNYEKGIIREYRFYTGKEIAKKIKIDYSDIQQRIDEVDVIIIQPTNFEKPKKAAFFDFKINK